MAWQLEIHHIDVTSAGDSTLIVARDIGANNQVNDVKAVLVDGGGQQDAGNVHAYLRQQLGNHKLDVMIATHYDMDHCYGLIQLLLTPGLYDNVTIYDQGWQSDYNEVAYINYLRAVNGLGIDGGQIDVSRRTRETRAVGRDPRGAAVDPTGLGLLSLPVGGPAIPASIDEPPFWLLVDGPPDILWGWLPGDVPADAPTMQCIAVNGWVRSLADGKVAALDQQLDADRSKNQRSLAFVVTFDGFRYYIGGDIETTQENMIQQYLNFGNDAAGRVLAIKTSHHGANTATSRAFVDRLRPAAAFISCGTRNIYGHPAQETVNVLDGFTGTDNPPHPEVPPNRPVQSYLTGYQYSPPPRSRGGEDSVAAGDPTVDPPIRGDVVVKVDAAPSNNDALGQLYHGVQAAAGASGVVGAPGAAPATAAAEAALSFGAVSVAQAFLAAAGYPAQTAAIVTPAAEAAVTASGATPETVAIAVAGAALQLQGLAGPGPRTQAAAGAGAAAGAAYGGGDATSVEEAVEAALLKVRLIPSQAARNAAQAAATVANSAELFTVTCYWREHLAECVFPYL